MTYWLTVCKTGQSTIVCTISMFLAEMVIFPIINKAEGIHWTLNRQLTIFQIVVVCFVFLSTSSMIITYIVRIRGKMAYLVIENLNLLNKMHEGLIVVDEDNLSLQFASMPAVNLIKQSTNSTTIAANLDQSNQDGLKSSIQQDDLSLPIFTPTKMSLKAVTEKEDTANKADLVENNIANGSENSVRQPCSLKSIVTTQLQQLQSQNILSDNSPSPVTIYQTKNKAAKASGDSSQTTAEQESSYTMVRVKKIDYLEIPAIAIYFYNMTQQVQQLRLESKLLEQTNRNESLQSYTSTISHEFRTPIGTALMLLEQMLQSSQIDIKGTKVINLIISQLNFLLCLVNDVLDMKQIEHSRYTPTLEMFNPTNVLEFIIAIFQPQSDMQRTSLTYETVTIVSSNRILNEGLVAGTDLTKQKLPKLTLGDHVRLKQVMINLIKNAFKFTRRGHIKIVAAYDEIEQMLHCHVIDSGKGIKEDEMG